MWQAECTGYRRMVVLIDDEEDVRDALGDLIAAKGYVVKKAGDGAEALQLLRAIDTPCVILLDLVMPVMDGWQLLTELRSSASLRTIPVVVISAHAGTQPITGVQRVLSKPVDPQDLYAAVVENCGIPN